MTLQKNKNLVVSLASAFLLACVVGIIIPLQGYLPHAESFAVPLSRVLFALSIKAVLLLVFGFLVSVVLRRWIGHYADSFIIALVLVCMAECGPLSIGLPVLNGDFSGYESVTRKVADGVVLLLLFCIPFVLKRWLKDYVVLISAGLLLFAASSLFDVKQTAQDNLNGLVVNELQDRREVVSSVTYSKEENVILLILDSVSVDVAQDVLRANPEIAKSFVGFVNYVNNVGMHWYTSLAVPGLLTGRHFSSVCELASYGKSYWGNESVICPYLDKDLPVYVNVSPGAFGGTKGFTNRPKVARKPEADRDGFAIQMHGSLSWTLDEITLFRILPYAFKKRFAISRAAKWSQEVVCTGNLLDDRILWPILGKAPVVNAHKTLNIHHTNGAHPPLTYDESGKPVAKIDPTYDDYRAQSVYVFKLIAELLSTYRAMGIYDQATIIVAADHGVKFTRPGRDLKGVPQEAYPCLLVKAAGERGSYAESELSTSHKGIAAVIKAAAMRTLSKAEIEKMLVCDERLCRMADNGKIKDWLIDKKGDVKFQERSDRELKKEELRPIVEDKVYQFCISMVMGEYPDFCGEGYNRQSTVGVNHGLNPMRMVFKTAHPNCTCRVSVFLTTWDCNRVDMRTGLADCHFQAETKAWVDHTFSGILASTDDEGFLELAFESSAAGYGFCVRTLKVEDFKERDNSTRR